MNNQNASCITRLFQNKKIHQRVFFVTKISKFHNLNSPKTKQNNRNFGFPSFAIPRSHPFLNSTRFDRTNRCNNELPALFFHVGIYSSQQQVPLHLRVSVPCTHSCITTTTIDAIHQYEHPSTLHQHGHWSTWTSNSRGHPFTWTFDSRGHQSTWTSNTHGHLSTWAPINIDLCKME